ncbi:MAG: HAD-IC family P-type ATPase, partial [Candidatus Saccharimonadales bacterium]
NSFSRDQVLGLAAALEQSSNHVLAQAIVEKARGTSVKIAKARNVHELAGNGLQAIVNNKKVLVGRLGLLQDSDIELPKQFNARDIQSTAAFVAIDGKMAGVITFKDEIRPEAKQTLQSLRDMGISDIMMVTGDNQATAKAVAHKLGIKSFHAEALPGDKIRAIEEASNRPIAFVGDGVNDAPVLTSADVGIALGARGSTAASESADIVIMKDNLEHVAESREIARRTFFIAKQSIFVGIGLSVILMLVFATGKFKPIYGAAIQEVVDIVVIFNALRAHSIGNGRVGRKKRNRTKAATA